VFLELPGALSNTTRKLLGNDDDDGDGDDDDPPDLAASTTLNIVDDGLIVDVTAIDNRRNLHTDDTDVTADAGVVVFFMVPVGATIIICLPFSDLLPALGSRIVVLAGCKKHKLIGV
jgi:hypothetical protein